MATEKESNLQGKDAAANTGTMAVIAAGDKFEGSIAYVGDADWIKIELSEGKEYTFTVGGDTTGTVTAPKLNDSVLELIDSKGGPTGIMNDDKDPEKGKLGSELVFAPQAGSGTQTYYIKVSGYGDNPGAVNIGDYTLEVSAVTVLPPGEGADKEGSIYADKLTGTNDSESIAGLAGNDDIYGLGGDDTLKGGAGNDLLIGGAGADTLNGGTGTDTISYEDSEAGVSVNLLSGRASGGEAAGDTLGTDIEYIIGSDYDDMLTGTDLTGAGGGVNKLWGGKGDDTLSGKEGDDTLYGGAGNDTLDGGDEDDTLEGGPGEDMLIGGAGADTASYASSLMGVTVRLHANQAMGGDAEGDTFVDMTTEEYSVPAADPEDPDVIKTETVPDIVNLTGSRMGDTLAGDSRDNTLMGGAGNDKLYGGPGGGDDKLHGEKGNDHLYGGRGDDDLYGGDDTDTLSGGSGKDDFYGGAGNDMIYAEAAATGTGTLVDGVIDGGEDDDGMDIDTVSFERMVDAPIGSATTAFRLGSRAGDNNLIPASVDAVGIERVIGTSEDDFITGANQSADGKNDAPEEIEGGDGGDTLVGGTGSGDTVSYASSDRRVRVDLNDNNPSGGHATGDNIDGFENVKGSAHGDVLTALAAGSTLWGLGGDDTLEGRGGDDTLEGGAGADELDGGYTTGVNGGYTNGSMTANRQINTLSYAGSDAGVTVNLASASASGGHADGDDIETYEYTDNNNTSATTDDEDVDVATFLNVTGSVHNDHLTGDRFGNTLTGSGGEDTLRGGDGADTLEGGPGADRLDGGSSLATEDNPLTTDDESVHHEDWASYRGAMEGVTVNLNTGNGTGGEDAMGDTLKNIELIWGSTHDDMFIASEGADIIHGDGGSDTVSYKASKHGVTIDLAAENATSVNVVGTTWTAATTGDNAVPAKFNPATDTMFANWRNGGSDGNESGGRPTAVEADDSKTTTKSYAEGDILASIENVEGSRQDDTITGDAVPNVLKGGDGDDTLSGEGQDDKLYGDAGIDTLNGGAGEDKLMGGAGNDILNGDEDTDTLNGGAGDDTLTGGGGADTYVFEPGNGEDVIATGFTTTGDSQDKINLKAFGIKAADLAGLISLRAGNTVIDLEDYGGGTITIQGVDPDELDTTATSVENNTVDFSTGSDGVIDDTGVFIL